MYSTLINVNCNSPEINFVTPCRGKLLRSLYGNRTRDMLRRLCDDLKKIYWGTDGNSEEHVVCKPSLALVQGECFGMVGPNGAERKSFINMVSVNLT